MMIIIKVVVVNQGIHEAVIWELCYCLVIDVYEWCIRLIKVSLWHVIEGFRRVCLNQGAEDVSVTSKRVVLKNISTLYDVYTCTLLL